MAFNGAVFETAVPLENVQQAVNRFHVAMEQGYLRGRLFDVIANGSNEDAVKRFLSGPFAEMRAPFSRWLAISIARFPDNAETEALAHNLSDEFGEQEGRLSHAALYRRLLDELDVPVEEGNLSFPATPRSLAAFQLKEFCERVVATKSFPYILGFFAGFEATDGPNFERLGVAVRRIWPDRSDLYEFFDTHAASEHGSTFVRNLDPLFQQNRAEFLRGMQEFLSLWEKFYDEAATEVGVL